MANTTRAIGVFGGTFDPIHIGHLRIALEVLEALRLAEIRFIPSRTPPHRGTPAASAAQRLEMIKLALAGQAGFVADDREVRRVGPSYTADTLAELRVAWPVAPLCLLLGLDAFRDLHHWQRWQVLPELAHLVIVHRPGAETFPLPAVLQELVAQRRSQDPADLARHPAGRIVFQAVTQLDISATAIRATIAAGRSPRYLVPDAVQAYIERERLYRPLESHPRG